jgi:Ca-activated chloride channel homolog
MRRFIAVCGLFLLTAGATQASGVLLPKDRSLPPLGMVRHHVSVTVTDQAAVTEVEQVFRNHTDRQLEAQYVFPVPKGASVRKFSMWVDGRETAGEMLEADKARKIYTDIVRRTLDPGLLEYISSSVFQVRVFPIPPHGDQKIKLVYTSVAPADNGVVEYTYPLRNDLATIKPLENFSLQIRIKSQHAVQSVYSPSHNIVMTRTNDHEAVVSLETDQARLGRDFQLFYTAGGKDVGLTALTFRPDASEPGYFMILAAPRVELSRERSLPRDMVFVLDSSGSMRGKRIVQAKAALKYCLRNLSPDDRFNILHFATAINLYKDRLLPASSDRVQAAIRWVDDVQANGGTAINDALLAALDMRGDDSSRPLTIVFFTDGQPTVGQTNPDIILKNVMQKNNASTRIFTFGVGDDVNASLLDQLADQTRAVSTYVRESEDIEAKVSGLYAKISNPVLSNLTMAASGDASLSEIYPPHLPDLFQGTQLVLLGRYSGAGTTTIRLTGHVGKQSKEFSYTLEFPRSTADDRGFVADLWARRKVGYLLDQIRMNGARKELVDEVVALAKRFGITTPYTSYLVVPDGPAGFPGGRGAGLEPPALLRDGVSGGKKVGDVIKAKNAGGQTWEEQRSILEKDRLDAAAKGGKGGGDITMKAARDAQAQLNTFKEAQMAFEKRDLQGVQTGSLGVKYSLQMNDLRNQTQITNSAVRNAFNRNCMEIGGVWIDDKFDPAMKTFTIKAMSDGYFRLLERQPNLRQVYALGNHVVWVTPSGTALVIDTRDGVEAVEDAVIDRLFTPGKK